MMIVPEGSVRAHGEQAIISPSRLSRLCIDKKKSSSNPLRCAAKLAAVSTVKVLPVDISDGEKGDRLGRKLGSKSLRRRNRLTGLRRNHRMSRADSEAM
jgi:hypothetical protein